MWVSIVLLFICLYFIILTTRRPRNFPQGPIALPIVGNLLYLSLVNPLKDIERLRRSYGNVYSLFIGPKPAVIINGFKAMKEAMVTKGLDFAGRPQNLYINAITLKKGVILADYGLSWKEHRRFALKTLRSFGMGRNSMEDRIHGEIQYIIKTLEDSNGKTMSPHILFHNAASNIICQVLFGKRYEYDDEFITDMVQSITENVKLVNGPWSMRIHSYLMTEHKKTRVLGEPRDFVDCYLDEMAQRVEDSLFSEEQLCRNAQDLYIAGTDTTSNTLLAGFLHLTNNPHVQERCQQDIDQVLEGKAQATFEDRHKLPYVQAVIHEIQRMSNIVPLNVFHCTTSDTELMGYSLPKGTMVIENMASVLHEEGQWRFPHEFNPENLLNDKGEFIKPKAFMPFSAGPRVCVGEARMELFLILVTLLRKFKFIWPEDAGEPDFTPVFGITMTPRPYRMKVQLRSTKG